MCLYMAQKRTRSSPVPVGNEVLPPAYPRDIRTAVSGKPDESGPFRTLKFRKGCIFVVDASYCCMVSSARPGRGSHAYHRDAIYVYVLATGLQPQVWTVPRHHV